VNVQFAERVRSRDVVAGTFLNLASPLVAEIVVLAGMDWVVIDLEHGAGTEGDALAQMHAIRRTGAGALVRVESLDRARIGHALDLGADGVVVPRLEGADDARLAVDACRYAGSRGVARYNRAWQWGMLPGTKAEADRGVVVVAQIETRSALESVDEIAAVDGVDVVFVGPADLAHSLGIDGPADDPELLEHAHRVAAAAGRAGKAAGMLVPTLEAAAKYRRLGFTFLGCASDGGFVVEGARRAAQGLKELTNTEPAVA
jgi:2-keto-3-deoxy-L-rhamnonate aldolase RhmA